MKDILYSIAFTLMVLTAKGQPGLQWQKCLGGNGDDILTALQPTTDGGYVIAGFSSSNDHDVTGTHGSLFYDDYWLIKLDASLAIQWSKVYGGDFNDDAYSVAPTSDGGYFMTGWSVSNNGDVTGHHGTNATTDCWLVKTDAAGNMQWQKSLGGTVNDVASAGIQTTDGGYIIAGYSFSSDGDITNHHGDSLHADVWVVKLDTGGNVQWQKSYGGTDNDFGYSIVQSPDGGYLVAASSWSSNGDVTGHHGASDYWLLKLTSTGDISWQKSIGGTDIEEPCAILRTSDGYILAGYSESADGDATMTHGALDCWVVKTNDSGAVQWQHAYGGTGMDRGYDIRATNDGGYVITGESSSQDGDATLTHGNGDEWVFKIDNVGTLQWQLELGGSGSDGGRSVAPLNNGAYLAAGYTLSPNDGNVTGAYGGDDGWLTKFSAPLAITEATAGQGVLLYPNPASNVVTLSNLKPGADIIVRNALGQPIYNAKATTSTEVINVSSYPSGIYFVNNRSFIKF